jgi:hypothetical protein
MNTHLAGRVAVASLLALLTASPLLHAQNPGDSVFSKLAIYTIDLRFPQPDYWDSLRYYYAQGDEQCIMAQVFIDGILYDSVGVRLKGNSSYTHPNDKKSFKINFDEYSPNLRWDQMKGVHLNNCWGDPTFMREYLHLRTCREAGVPAPRGNYALLYLNGEMWGLYSLVEHVDKKFLKPRFGNSDGDLFKAVDAFDPSGSQTLFSDFVWYGPDDTAYTSRYELKTDGSATAWPQLISFIDTLNHCSDPDVSLPAIMNVPGFAAAMAMDNLFGNLDSYAGSGRNFYLYFNTKTKKAEWVAWDAGLSFGVFQPGVPKPETMSVTYLGSAASRPLAAALFNAPVMRDLYLHTLCTLTAIHFSPLALERRIDSVAEVIRPFVAMDMRKMYTLQQFETNILTDITAEGGGGQRKPGLKSFITARYESVLSQLIALGAPCLIDAAESAPSAPAGMELEGGHPNPFSTGSSIAFTLTQPATATVDLYSVLGTHVATLAHDRFGAGRHTLRIDGQALRPGVYLCRLLANGATQTRMVTCVK